MLSAFGIWNGSSYNYKGNYNDTHTRTQHATHTRGTTQLPTPIEKLPYLGDVTHQQKGTALTLLFPWQARGGGRSVRALRLPGPAPALHARYHAAHDVSVEKFLPQLQALLPFPCTEAAHALLDPEVRANHTVRMT